MSRISHWLLPVSLVMAAVYIWLRDTTWISSGLSVAPILLAAPIALYFGRPWTLKTLDRQPLVQFAPAVGLGLLAAAFDSTLVFSIAWTSAAWSWLRPRLPAEQVRLKRRLLPFFVLAFPGFALEAQTVGWYFRLSGASVTANLYQTLGANVVHAGTHVTINNVPLDVEPACAGLNTFQVLLLVGATIAYVSVPSRWYWLHLPITIAFAWIANTVRVIMIAGAAAFVSAKFASGLFHSVGGAFVVVLAVFMIAISFELLERRASGASSA